MPLVKVLRKSEFPALRKKYIHVDLYCRQAKSEYVEWRAVANIDTDEPSAAKRAYGRMRWNGSLYHMTGALLAEAALIIARDKTYAHELAGGILTPATLGEKYLERMQIVGLQTEFKLLAQ